MADAIRLDGKVAIITGGAGGIGFATAQLMTARGARVVIADIAAERAAELAATLEGALAIPLNLEEEGSIEALISETIVQCGRLDFLVNNALMRLIEHFRACGTIYRFILMVVWPIWIVSGRS